MTITALAFTDPTDHEPLLFDAREIKPGMRIRRPADRCVREAPCAQYRTVAAVSTNVSGTYSSVDITFTDGTAGAWHKRAEFEVDPDSIPRTAEDRAVAAAYARLMSQLFEVEAFRADRPAEPADVVPFFAASFDDALDAARQILAEAGARWGNLLADGRDVAVIEVAR